MFFEQNHLQEQFSNTRTSSAHLKMDPEKNEKSISEPGNVSYAPSSEGVQAIK
jgi:hypothetical protein